MPLNLDTICQMTRKPSTLNALHACRPNHPLGRGTKTMWSNAWALAAQDDNISETACDWLRQKAVRAGEIEDKASELNTMLRQRALNQ